MAVVIVVADFVCPGCNGAAHNGDSAAIVAGSSAYACRTIAAMGIDDTSIDGDAAARLVVATANAGTTPTAS